MPCRCVCGELVDDIGSTSASRVVVSSCQWFPAYSSDEFHRLSQVLGGSSNVEVGGRRCVLVLEVIDLVAVRWSLTGALYSGHTEAVCVSNEVEPKTEAERPERAVTAHAQQGITKAAGYKGSHLPLSQIHFLSLFCLVDVVKHFV